MTAYSKLSADGKTLETLVTVLRAAKPPRRRAQRRTRAAAESFDSLVGNGEKCRAGLRGHRSNSSPQALD
jgi:hypothetical protein